VSTCPSEVRAQIRQAALQATSDRASRKRQLKTEKQQRYRAKKQRISEASTKTSPENSREEGGVVDGIGDDSDRDPVDSQTGDERDTNRFLDIPSEEGVRDCYRRFRAATSNDSLAQAVCASCARLLMRNDLSSVNYLSLPNQHLLRPVHPHKAHTLTSGMLLVSEHLNLHDGEATGWICRHCLSALKRNRTPAYTLANNMWIGPTPPALAMLTIPEQLLIALRYPRGFIFKLYPRGGQGSDYPDALQTGLRGNVTTYTANVQAVVEMLQGQMMPRAAAILPSLIAVTFVGRQSLSRTRLKSIFRVRRRVVHAALLELKHTTEHPGYANLDISEDTLALLPEDAVPEEILTTLRLEAEEAVVERESAGYVPTENEDSQS
jgi:hypothetical protein